MAKRKKIQDNLNDELVKVNATVDVVDEIQVIDDKEPAVEIDSVVDDIVEEIKVNEPKPSKDTAKITKKPIMFGYIWNGQEFD